MDVYIIGGDNEPTQFKNDFEFRKQTYLKISSSSFPNLYTFVAAVRVSGIEYNGNIYHMTTL